MVAKDQGRERQRKAPGRPMTADNPLSLSRNILRFANRGLPRIAFLREVSNMLLDFSGCDALALRLRDGDLRYRWIAARRPQAALNFQIVPPSAERAGHTIPNPPKDSVLERVCRDIAVGRFNPALPCFTDNGSFWTGDTSSPLEFIPFSEKRTPKRKLTIGGEYRSLAIIPFLVDEETVGLMLLRSEKVDYFDESRIALYEGVAQSFGLAVADRRAQVALRERVKELTCLYGIAQIAERQDLTLDEKLQRIVELLPLSWQHPDIAVARMVLSDQTYQTIGFQEGWHRQAADIFINGERVGFVEVIYVEDKPELEEGPFLKEEVSLISEVARQIAVIIEKGEAEKEKIRLQEQLRHADRLATIGQLAAGIAHELNEPLGSILGFAQLAKKSLSEPEQANRDLDKIVNASLFARETVRKLLIFARQMPTRKTTIDFNYMVKEALSFFESRCRKEGINLVKQLNDDPLEIEADPAQMNQILVNLVVNAIQVMPNGGDLTVRTASTGSRNVVLVVEDTGTGMSEEVRRQIFIPFFTTKDLHQGTGLGLSVVHGIVTSHGGTVEVESEVGRGSRFEIVLPVRKRENQGEKP